VLRSVVMGEQLMKKILLVNNDPERLDMFKDFFDISGIPVRCAHSGEEALFYLHRDKFNVMITDLNMHMISGIELATKAASIAPRMKIIMVTESISPELLESVKKIGISSVINKPVKFKTLMQIIDGTNA
jgi:CheY-like chemotaxis protein